MTNTEQRSLLEDAIRAALKGGREILEVYQNRVEITYKDDNSPLTEADKRSHQAIAADLQKSGIPILSEEGRHGDYEERKNWSQLWIVDPLDGTKEFIKQNGEFTVNIALVQDQVAQLGVIYLPVEHMLYFAAPDVGSYRVQWSPEASFDHLDDLIEAADALPLTVDRPFTMVGSRSHMSDETAEYFEGVRAEYPDAEVISKGSSLKICMVAEGSADVYPRFAPTMEWDTAAGHAIARVAGFEMLDPKTDQPLLYNKRDLLNPWFIVKRR